MSDEAVSRVIQNIQRVDLRVQDVDRALEFYSGIVGLEVAAKSGGKASAREPGGRVLVNLDSNGVTGPAEPTAAGLFHTAIRFPTRPSLGQALRRVAEAGLEIGAADHGVSEALYIDDPSGNGVELYWDRPREAWPKPDAGERIKMFSKPLDLQDILRTGDEDDEPSPGAPAATDIGHVHLQASDLDETTTFYEDVLGFDLVTQLWSQASFLSAQGYHHHIGANVWRSRGRPAARPDGAGLSRIVFAAGDDRELGLLLERLGRPGAGPDSQNGELTVVDPNGVELVFEKS